MLHRRRVAEVYGIHLTRSVLKTSNHNYKYSILDRSNRNDKYSVLKTSNHNGKYSQRQIMPNSSNLHNARWALRIQNRYEMIQGEVGQHPQEDFWTPKKAYKVQVYISFETHLCKVFDEETIKMLMRVPSERYLILDASTRHSPTSLASTFVSVVGPILCLAPVLSPSRQQCRCVPSLLWYRRWLKLKTNLPVMLFSLGWFWEDLVRQQLRKMRCDSKNASLIFCLSLSFSLSFGRSPCPLSPSRARSRSLTAQIPHFLSQDAILFYPPPTLSQPPDVSGARRLSSWPRVSPAHRKTGTRHTQRKEYTPVVFT